MPGQLLYLQTGVFILQSSPGHSSVSLFYPAAAPLIRTIFVSHANNPPALKSTNNLIVNN
jgi:hypothetical protein